MILSNVCERKDLICCELKIEMRILYIYILNYFIYIFSTAKNVLNGFAMDMSFHFAVNTFSLIRSVSFLIFYLFALIFIGELYLYLILYLTTPFITIYSLINTVKIL